MRFSDSLLNVDQPVRIVAGSRELFSGQVSRTIGILAKTLEERLEPKCMFDAEVQVAF